MTFAALAADWVQARSRKSLFFNVKLNVKGFQIMVDTGATHNFVTEERAKGLCLNYVACDTFLKTANALPTTVHDFAPKVPIDLGVWKRVKPHAIMPYHITLLELKELRKQLKELFDPGHIRPSMAPFKKGKGIAFVIDNQALNKVEFKKKYLIPLIAHLFDRSGQAKLFIKMDLSKGYYQVHTRR
uniref:Reverse transcriptase domain-containing protein n=1 Tax=Solanum lycopersicum TaxID=4081 RepID=A0A3Q7EW71_SOLLC